MPAGTRSHPSASFLGTRRVRVQPRLPASWRKVPFVAARANVSSPGPKLCLPASRRANTEAHR